jgi:hypothetical protein
MRAKGHGPRPPEITGDSYKPSKKKSNAEPFRAVKKARVCARDCNRVDFKGCRTGIRSPLFPEDTMHLFIWRHSKRFSSWSMLDEPHIHKENYLQADVTVLAASKAEALDLLERNGSWNLEELQRIEPEVIPVDAARIITSHLVFQ